MNTDKQPQTVYVPTKNKSDFKILDPNFGTVNAYVKTGYFHTPEELEALLQKERASGQWISVKDRLPEKMELVLTYGKMFGWIQCGILCDNGIWLKSNLEKIKIKPTHWMPLPKPPKK